MTQTEAPTTTPPRQIAVVGSGIAGLSAAWHLAQDAEVRVTLFEADTRLGGHAQTVDVTVRAPSGAAHTFGVDTGFLVFNHKTYPGLTAFFEQLGVVTAPSDMGFSVQVGSHLEWAGNSLSSVFTQRKNICNPLFLGMLKGMLRFNQAATRYAINPPSTTQTLGEYLAANHYSVQLRDWYLIPMAAAIWSCPTETMLAYPMATFSRFCHNHGLLQVANRPRWYTVAGGSRNYVTIIQQALRDKEANICMGSAVSLIERHVGGQANAKVTVHTAQTSQKAAQSARFDAVVLATHSDQTLKMLANPSSAEQRILGSIRYQANCAVLHTDRTVLPSHPRAWAAWNYETQPDTRGVEGISDAVKRNAKVATGMDASPSSQRVCLHYLLNKLQPLPVGMDTPVIVSLNPIREIDPANVIQSFDYEHPVFDSVAITAQQALTSLQGQGGVWFAGAWAHYGFHEDGFQSGKAAAQGVLS